MVSKFFSGSAGVFMANLSVMGRYDVHLWLKGCVSAIGIDLRGQFPPIINPNISWFDSFHCLCKWFSSTQCAILYTVIGIYVDAIHICHTGLEWTGPSKIALCTSLILLSGSAGLILLPGIAYFVRNWRMLQLALFSPLLLIVALLYWSVASRDIMPRQVLLPTSVNREVINVTCKLSFF